MRTYSWSFLFSAACVYLIGGCPIPAHAIPTYPEVQTYSYQVIERVDHDVEVFTQGFVFDHGWFYQSSGLYKKSFLRRYPADQSQAAQNLAVPPSVFAEGLTLLGDDLFLISWHAGTAWRFDAPSLNLEKTFRYSGDGWGLTDDEQNLIMSDGSDQLRIISAEDFSTLKTLSVRKSGAAVRDLNELEYAEGLIWANQWRTNNIYGIDANSGEVKIQIDISELQMEAKTNHIDSVANGIAYDEQRQLFWLTGKYWRYRYLIKLIKPGR